MKHCKRCDLTLDKSKFTKSACRKDGLQSYCQECMKLYRKEHYANNKQAHYARNKKTQSELRQIVLEAKSLPCFDCGVTYPGEPWLMELDHRNPKEKEGLVAVFVYNGQRNKLMKELAKCDPVCVVCHRRRTAKMLDWVDNRFRE